MKLSNYEIKVIKLMLKSKLSLDDWTKFIKDHDLVYFEYTGAGYFIKIKVNNLTFKQETISEPVVIGQAKDFSVGFLLYVDENEIIMECHSWSKINPPENVRDLDVEIIINNDLLTKR